MYNSLTAALAPEVIFANSPALQNRFGLPPTELVLESFTCALKQKSAILLQGRIYVFPHHVGFACDILGQNRTIIISFSEIFSMKKAKTAMFVPNAIEISTCSSDRYIFTSFIYRNEAYRMIHNLWAIAKGIAAFQDRLATTIARSPSFSVGREQLEEGEEEAEEEQNLAIESQDDFPAYDGESPPSPHAAAAAAGDLAPPEPFPLARGLSFPRLRAALFPSPSPHATPEPPALRAAGPPPPPPPLGGVRWWWAAAAAVAACGWAGGLASAYAGLGELRSLNAELRVLIAPPPPSAYPRGLPHYHYPAGREGL